MKDILSRNWMLQSERELAQQFGQNRGKPNMCWTTFKDRILNSQEIRKNCPISSEALYTELKWGGAKDGKMKGYKIPKEKKLEQMLFILGYSEPQEKKPIIPQPVDKPDALDIVEQQLRTENKPTESEAAKEACEIKNPLAVCMLKFYYQQNWKIGGSEFRRNYPINVKMVHAASDYLVKEGIFKTNGKEHKGVRYSWAIPGNELVQFYPWIKHPITNEELVAAKIKVPKKIHVPEPWESVMIPSVTNYLDSLTETHPYSIQDLAATFNLDSHNAVCLQNYLLEEGLLAETQKGISPTYLWQKPAVKEGASLVPHGKDLVIEGSRVRVINESGKEIQLLVKDNEIILKV